MLMKVHSPFMEAGFIETHQVIAKQRKVKYICKRARICNDIVEALDEELNLKD